MNERRDPHRRADVLRRVVQLLRARREGVSPTELTSEVPPSAAERILTRLALRGLARVESGKWVPTPVLLYDIPLVPGSLTTVR